MLYLERSVVALSLLCLSALKLSAADVKPAMPEYTSLRRLAENVTLACEGIHDQAEHAAMIVLWAILNGCATPGGWLHNELRGEGLVYYVQSTELTGPVPGYFVITAQTRPDKLDEVVRRIRRNLDRGKQGKIPEDEFRTAIDQVTGLHAQENVTIGQQASTAALDELYGLGYDYDQKFDAQIRAVTLPDVVRVARKYFTNSVLVTTSPETTTEQKK